MAISVRSSAAWSVVTADSTVTLPTHAAGDRIYVFAAWKPFGTTAQVSGWTEVTEFADGSVANGANVGSVKVAGWYLDATSSSETNPTVDWSASPAPGARCAIVLQKDASDSWDTPTFVTAAISAATNWSATSSTTITIKDGAIVLELVGFRDESATMTRSATTALEDDGSPNVTWNGNVVEDPATHASSTTSNDISADLIHRFVTTGASGVNLTATGTLSASETGAVLWVHQGVTPSVSASAEVSAGTGSAHDATADISVPSEGPVEEEQVTGTSDVSSTTLVTSADGPTSDGNLSGEAGLFIADVVIRRNAGNGAEVTGISGGGLTWALWPGLHVHGPDDGRNSIEVWYAIGTPSGGSPFTVTITFDNAVNAKTVRVRRFSGYDATTPIDNEATATAPDGDDANPSVSHGTTVDNSLANVVLGNRTRSISATDPDYTFQTELLGNVGGSGVHHNLATKEMPTAGSLSYSVTLSGTSSAWCLVAYAIRPASSSVPVEADAEVGSGTGVSNQPRTTIAPRPAASTGTGASSQPLIWIRVFAGNASGTGAAGAASARIGAFAGHASGTAVASNATGKPNELTPAGLASGTGSGYSPIPLIKPNAGLSSGTGAAHAPPISIAPRAAHASGTGSAFNATARPSISVQAGHASGTGAAGAASARTAPNAGNAAGTGAASAPRTSVAPRAGNAAGTGAANNATGRPSVAASAGHASGTGQAYNATARSDTFVIAVGAAGTGAAAAPSASVAPRTNAASGIGAADGGGSAPSIEFDAETEFSDTSPPLSVEFVHTPVGTPSAIVVALVVTGEPDEPSAFDVTYGGVSMTEIDTAWFPGDLDRSFSSLFFLGSDVPTGAQTISATWTAAFKGGAAYAAAISYIASDDCVVLDSGIIAEANNWTNATIPLDWDGELATTVVALYFGGTPAQLTTIPGDLTNVIEVDDGQGVIRVDRQTTPSTSDYTVAYASSVSREMGMVAAAIGVANEAGGTPTHVHIAPHADPGDATGIANDAVTQADVSVSAQAATGGGAANNAFAHIKPSAGSAAGTGSAHNVSASTTDSAPAEAASGTGSANQPRVAIAPRAAAATGTGSASNATARLDTFALAQAAGGTGAAGSPLASIAPIAGSASGTGSANDAGVSTTDQAPAETAQGSGAADQPNVSIAPRAGSAAGTGEAFAATTAQARFAEADLAVGTGEAFGVATDQAVAVMAGHSSGSGQAFDATGSVATRAEPATGSGQAGDVAVQSGDYAQAEPAEGAAEALQPIASVRPMAGHASGSGEALGARVPTGAGHAAGTGEALGSNASIAAGADQAIGSGEAFDAPASVGAGSEHAPGSGESGAVIPFIAVHAGLAEGSGEAGNVSSSQQAAAFAGIAEGTGEAIGPSVSLSGSTGNAAGSGAAGQAVPSVVANAAHAEGTGTAYDASVQAISAQNFALNAVLLAEQGGTFSLSAVLRRAYDADFGLDATIRKTAMGGFDLEAVLLSPQTGSLSANAVIQKTLSGSFGLDALQRKTFASAFGLDAYLVGSAAGAFDIQAVIKATLDQSFGLGAVVVGEDIPGHIDFDGLAADLIAFSPTVTLLAATNTSDGLAATSTADHIASTSTAEQIGSTTTLYIRAEFGLSAWIEV